MLIKLNVAIRVPDESPREFDLTFSKSVITVGRDRDNDVQLPLGSVSRKHAKLLEENGNWFVEDLRSTHGMKINGQALNPGGKKLLRDGDQIQIVHAFITFYDEASEQFEEELKTDESTNVVAQKLVKNAVNNLDEQEDLPHLVFMNGSIQGKIVNFKANESEIVLGRGENSEVRLDDVNTSRKHAVFSRDRNEFFVEDLGSKNGTMVNGKIIHSKTLIKDADEIYLGSTQVVFVDPQAHILSKLGQMSAFSKTADVEEANIAKQDSFDHEGDTKPPGKGVNQESVVDATNSVSQTAPDVVIKSKTIRTEKKFGTVEYTLLALLGFVVVGLIVGMVVALG